ncbi:MAG TPA: LysR family transcriptional regulator [Gemmatimonadaceae bacterium]|nr:LysR family transcriptional regulator [Gemmatimonadaceae bacterium]
MTLETKDLRLVAAVAEHGGLTRAGAVLYLTQSALSHQLADLERRLGTPLFTRQGKRMVPTPAGERLVEAARELLSSLGRAERDVRDTAARRDGLLRLSTECYTCYHWLPGVIREYQRSFARVELRIVAEATRRPVPALLRGQLDLAIMSTPVRDRRLESTPLFRDEMVAVVPPGHPWTKKRFVSANDFADEHLLSYSISRQESTLFREVLTPAGITPRQVSQVELTEAIVELVRAGLGVGVLARWAVAPHEGLGAVETVRIGESGLQREWSAVALKLKSTPLHLRAFIDVLSHHLVPRRRGSLTVLRT